MNSRSVKLSALLIFMASVFAASNGWSAASLIGDAELSYTKYEASEKGQDIFSGNSLVQKYFLAYTATNLYYRNQPRYYNIMAGYSLIDFNTKVVEPDQETTIKQNFGKIRYSGDVGYNAAGLPIRFKAYINDNQPLNLKSDINSSNLISDGLAYNLEGRGMSISSGVFFAFEPQTSRNNSLRALPRVILEYRDTKNKSSEGFYRIDNRTKELAVAGLNRENNWVNYRLVNYENYLQPLDNARQQQIQIGLVDHRGRRLWSSLTNWIDVSADAQLTEMKRDSSVTALEQYDINFMAIARRQKWDARTFMNYNRELTDDTLTETARVPVYLKGIYGAETDWHVGLSAGRGRENLLSARTTDTSYSNSISLGATTFSRSSFTLSPSINLVTSKGFGGYVSYSIDSNLETASTRRFSDKLGLAAKITLRAMDDGSNTSTSKTSSGKLDLNATYRPDSKLTFKVQDTIDYGNGAGFIDATLKSGGGTISNYLREYVAASAGWLPNARFSTSLQVTYDLVKAGDLPDKTEASVAYRASYSVGTVSYGVDSKYTRRDNGVNGALAHWRSSVLTQYKPDRYNDGLLQLTQDWEKDYNRDNTKLELLQRYSYKFYSTKGLMRNIATLTEEYSFTRTEYEAIASGDVHYLKLSGRYSPTDRYSLYGSAKYEKADPPGSITMYYSAGMSADFRLLSASVDYTLAKRDIDNRIEKKLAASVKRTF